MRENIVKSQNWPIKLNKLNSHQEIPIFIETEKSVSSPNFQKIIVENKFHIFILLHGLDATHANMIKLMKYISITCENAEFILPKGTLFSPKL